MPRVAGAVLPCCPGPAAAPAAAPGRASASRRPEPGPPPVVFVHGNGDPGAPGSTTIWRFEANGYKRNQLFAIDFTYPNARRDDSRSPSAFRSSTEDDEGAGARYVAQVLEGDARDARWR
mgnify:CR=1 FL=1